MNLEKIKSELVITTYDVVDEKSVIQARADITRIRVELRRIEAEKLRITKPVRELVSSFNSEVKKITDGLQNILDALTKSGNAYVAKQKQLAAPVIVVEKTGDTVTDAINLANSLTQVSKSDLPVSTRERKELKYDDSELKIWLAKNWPDYLTVDTTGIKKDLALLKGCPASIEIVEVL